MIGAGEAAAHPDAEASGGGPAGADVADEWRSIGLADVLAKGRLEERAEGPESQAGVDDLGLGLVGSRRFEVPAMLAVVPTLSLAIAALGCPPARVALAGVQPGGVGREQDAPAIRLLRGGGPTAGMLVPHRTPTGGLLEATVEQAAGVRLVPRQDRHGITAPQDEVPRHALAPGSLGDRPTGPDARLADGDHFVQRALPRRSPRSAAPAGGWSTSSPTTPGSETASGSETLDRPPDAGVDPPATPPPAATAAAAPLA
jgi:hypothetical protein